MAESMLGSKASSFLTKTTTVLAVIFFVISLAVTVLSIQRSKSLIGEQIPTKEQTEQTQEKENVQKEQALPAQQQTTPVQ
jgi:preprotein translocase subunit SecG